MFTLKVNGKLRVADRPLVMGILNITPDSFYPGSRVMDTKDLLTRAEKMILDGADILDIGGQSSRPGAEKVGVEEELQRVAGPISLIQQHFPETILSVDTFYAKVAREAVFAGASMVNDIGGGSLDKDMLVTVGNLGVPYVCMHMKGTPATMTKEAVYGDVTKEVLDYFIQRVEDCREAGIHDLILDPGLGFAKKPLHDLTLLKHLSVLKMPGRPLLLGVSRKSVIYRTLGITAEEALNGSTVLHTLGILNGADILRVHDPREARQVIDLMAGYRNVL